MTCTPYAKAPGAALGRLLFGLFLASAWTPLQAASGCDSIASIPITWNINYTVDIQSVFNTRCSNCHVDHGGNPSGDLDLDPEFSWDNLVNGPSFDWIMLGAPRDPTDFILASGFEPRP